MKCIVTGAAGFVGSSLSGQLLAQGHDVVGVDSFTDYYSVDIKRRNVADMVLSSRFRLVESDLNTVDIGSLVEGAEVVFHQAGQPGVRKSWGADFGAYIDANIAATQRLLEALKSSGSLQRFVYASSSSIYGEAEKYPTREVDTPQPISPYGVTKLAGEHLCTLYARNFGLPTVSLRYFTVYGPRQRTDMAFTRFIRAAVKGEVISIYGDGSQIRDFTYISDVVAANIACMVGDIAPGRVFNVAGGSSTSIREVLEIVQEIAGELRIEYGARVAGDVVRTGGNTERIHSELGWQAQVPIRDGLNKQFEWGLGEFQTRIEQ